MIIIQRQMHCSGTSSLTLLLFSSAYTWSSSGEAGHWEIKQKDLRAVSSRHLALMIDWLGQWVEPGEYLCSYVDPGNYKWVPENRTGHWHNSYYGLIKPHLINIYNNSWTVLEKPSERSDQCQITGHIPKSHTARCFHERILRARQSQWIPRTFDEKVRTATMWVFRA